MLTRPFSLVLMTGLAAATFVACGSSPEPDSPPDPGNATTLAHVHGLGVDPADGSLYAASHYGVFRIDEDGTATQVAGRWQDTMAFTVTGPSTFLASGHPDTREDLPPHLGLIRSTDAAETWTPVALEGEADFHALEVAGPHTFGFDALSGRLMVSPDHEDWTTITDTPVIDLAWTGLDADVVLATTRQGLVEYHVDGRAIDVEGAPPLALIDSPAPGRLVGITANGEVYSTADPVEGPWRKAPATVESAPQAMETTPDAWYVATERAIYRSADGRRWDLLVDIEHGTD